MKQIVVRVDDKTRRLFQIACLMSGKNMNVVLAEHVEKIIEESGVKEKLKLLKKGGKGQGQE